MHRVRLFYYPFIFWGVYPKNKNFHFCLFLTLYMSMQNVPVIIIFILNLICLHRNAYQEHCMGSYGGPVLPHVALGGFLAKNQTLSENPNYMLADTLVITLPINNFFNTSMLKPALAWEEVYVWLLVWSVWVWVDILVGRFSRLICRLLG